MKLINCFLLSIRQSLTTAALETASLHATEDLTSPLVCADTSGASKELAAAALSKASTHVQEIVENTVQGHVANASNQAEEDVDFAEKELVVNA